VKAASYFCDHPCLRSAGFQKRERLRQPDLGVAPQRSKLTAHSVTLGEGGVKERHTLDASIRNAQVIGFRINPTERERF